MSEVLPWLLIGDKAAAKNRELIRRCKVLYILNATPPKTDGGVLNFFEKEASLEYLRLPLRDVATDTILPHVPAAIEFLQRIRVRADGRVLVHCNEGKSRSAAIVAAFLVRAYGKTADEALEAVRAARPEAEPREAFVRQLATLEPATLDAVVDGFADASTAASGPSTGAGEMLHATDKRHCFDVADDGSMMPPPAKRAATGPSIGRPQDQPAGPAPRPTVGPAPRPAVGPAPMPAGPAPRPTVGPTPKPAVGPAPMPAGPAPRPTVGPAPRPAVGPAPRPTVGPAPRPAGS